METAKFVEKLERDLASVAALGGDAVTDAAERLIQALRSSAGLRLMEVLSEAALEISAQLPDGHVEVRLVGPDPQLVYVPAEPAEAPTVGPEDALTARITLRLPESLKRDLEVAAGQVGVSLNAWLVRALSSSTAPPPRRTSNRLSGYARG
jgi:HicB family